MQCPRCEAELENIHIDSEDYKVCKECGGMWLHAHQLNHLLREIGGDIEMCSIDDNSHTDIYPTIQCLECNKVTMKKINFMEYSDIIMDYCPSCGAFWIDQNELPKMHEYLEKVEEGSHDVKDPVAFQLLKAISELAYSVFK